MSADAEYDVLTAVCFLHAMLSPPAPNSAEVWQINHKWIDPPIRDKAVWIKSQISHW